LKLFVLFSIPRESTIKDSLSNQHQQVSIPSNSEYGVNPFVCLDDWLVLLNVATRFDFEGIRTHALNSIQQLPNLTSVQKINLSRQYNIRPDWVVSSLTDLVRRYRPISVEEAQSLGAEFVATLSSAREGWLAIQTVKGAFNSLTCNDCRSVDAHGLVCSECGTELEVFAEAVSTSLTPTVFVLDAFKLLPDGRSAS
jgi:hypothetical protein